MFKRTHIEQHMSQKKIIYSNAEYSPNRWSRYFTFNILLSNKNLNRNRIKRLEIFNSSRYPYLNSPITFNESYESSQNAESDNELNETFEALQPTINRRWKIVQWFTYFIYIIISLIVTPFKKIVQFFTSKKQQTTKRQISYHDIVQSSNNGTSTISVFSTVKILFYII